MIFSYEALAEGTGLYHHMLFRNPTDIEIGAMVGALKKFADCPYIAARKLRRRRAD